MARIIAAFTQFFDNAGDPLIDGKLQFLESGANNTDKNTFKDAALTPGMENTNPVILDGAGRLAFSVFGTGTYNVILFDSDDVQIQQFDPVGATSSGSQFSEWLATETYNKGDIVRATDNEYYQSFINDNNNNNPTSSPASWDLITIVKSYIGNASGTVDAITVDFVPVLHSLAEPTRVLVRASGANATTTPTFAPNGLAAKTIVKNGNQPLNIGDTLGEMDMVYNSSNDNWELLNPANLVFVADAAGVADVITVTFSPAVTALTDGLEVRVRALLANATTTPTINYNGLGAKTIVKNGNRALSKADISGLGHELQLVYNSSNDNVELLNPVSSITLSTPMTATGTSIDFTGIPAGIKSLTFNFMQVSTNSTSPLIMQIGDSGGIETTGYLSKAENGDGSGAFLLVTTGYPVVVATSNTVVISGNFTIFLGDESTNTWIGTGIMRLEAAATPYLVGIKDLSGVLDRVRFTTINGTDTFDLGKVNISWEF